LTSARLMTAGPLRRMIIGGGNGHGPLTMSESGTVDHPNRAAPR
jgi:hypothetical protein